MERFVFMVARMAPEGNEPNDEIYVRASDAHAMELCLKASEKYRHEAEEARDRLAAENKQMGELLLSANNEAVRLAAEVERLETHNAEWVERCKRFRKQDHDEYEAELDRLRSALREIAALNCADTCSSQLVEGCDCDCHVSIARNAIANIRHTGGIVEAGNTACILRND